MIIYSEKEALGTLIGVGCFLQDWGQIHSQLEIYFEERLSGKNL